MNTLNEILFKMNEEAKNKGRPIPFPPTKEGYQKLLRMLNDMKVKQHQEKI